MSATTTPRRWTAAAEEHEAALSAYLESAAALDGSAWQRPWAEGKWSPAQITEHLTLAYEVLLGEVSGGPAMQLRLSGWNLRLSRWLLLPHILFHGSIPVRAPAPRELRPEAPRGAQSEALRLLEEAGDRFQERLAEAYRAGGGRLTHPYFGEVDAIRGLRFVAVHLEHHRRQVEQAAA